MLTKGNGYTTLVGNVILALALAASIMGVEIPQEDLKGLEEQLVATLALVFNIINRFRTDSAVFKRSPR